jgi:hypothetical protein
VVYTLKLERNILEAKIYKEFSSKALLAHCPLKSKLTTIIKTSIVKTNDFEGLLMLSSEGLLLTCTNAKYSFR